jgi:hypothetical protein
VCRGGLSHFSSNPTILYFRDPLQATEDNSLGMHVVHVGVSFLFFVCWRNVQRICRHRRFTSSTLACIHASVAFLQNEALAVLRCMLFHPFHLDRLRQLKFQPSNEGVPQSADYDSTLSQLPPPQRIKRVSSTCLSRPH